MKGKPTRAALADAIEAAIAALDALDGDPDLEPSLGSLLCYGAFVSPEYQHYNQERWPLGAGNDDREEDIGDDREGSDDDAEPDGLSEAWTQNPNTPLVHRNTALSAWIMGERVAVDTLPPDLVPPLLNAPAR